MIVILIAVFSIGSRRVVQQTAIHSRTLSLLPSANCAENRVIENHLQLIHIYDNIPCGFLFSEFVPEFLDENYTVSSWDISNPVNQRKYKHIRYLTFMIVFGIV